MNELLHTYYKYKAAITNVMLLLAICAAVVITDEVLRSVSLGLAFGLALLKVGESIGQCAKVSDKDCFTCN